MAQLQGFLRLLRFERALSAIAGVILTGIIVGDLTGFSWDYLVAGLVVFFSALANFTVNDIHDLGADRLNNRDDRPLVTGLISDKLVFIIALLSALSALGLSLLLDPIPRILVFSGLPVSLIYNLYLKEFLLFKNLFTGLANVGVVLIGSLVHDSTIEPMAIVMASVGFFFSLSYEIMLDIRDIEGDKKLGQTTVPIRYGAKKAVKLSIILGFFSILVEATPYFIALDPRLHGDPFFLVMLLAPTLNLARISSILMEVHSPETVMRLRGQLFRNLQLSGAIYLAGFMV